MWLWLVLYIAPRGEAAPDFDLLPPFLSLFASSLPLHLLSSTLYSLFLFLLFPALRWILPLPLPPILCSVPSCVGLYHASPSPPTAVVIVRRPPFPYPLPRLPPVT